MISQVFIAGAREKSKFQGQPGQLGPGSAQWTRLED